MTIIVGIDAFTEAVMVSDSRVSWRNNQHPPQDILRKLYVIKGPENKTAVLGFSGLLSAASPILQFLIMEKLRGYKRPFIMVHLKEDLGRWIEEAAKAKLPADIRAEVKFMLCGIEPNRHPSVLRDGKVVSRLPFVEVHVYSYSINRKGRVSSSLQRQMFDVIGTGRKIEKEILIEVRKAMRFGFNQPNLQWARAVVMGEVIAAEITKVSKLSETVGGPFQVIRITSAGPESHYIWPSNGRICNVNVRSHNEDTIVSNLTTGQVATLSPVWKLQPDQLTGSG